MNEQIREQLSALMDGELGRDQARFLLRRITPGDASSACWERYHLARQVLRRQQAALPSIGFAESVMVRLEAEPSQRRIPTPWLRWSAGGAVAASVAMAALVLTRPALEPAPAPGAIASESTAPAVAPNAPATVLAASAPVNEFRPPLLVPNVPVEVSPASFGTSMQPPVGESEPPYLIRYYPSNGAAAQPGFSPYVLRGTPEPVQSAANR
jgi:sigma-E factor negative regulatory protein RseA